VQTAATSIDSVTGGVTIDWIAPHDGSQEITSYLIEIQNALATGFFEDETNCGGDNPNLTECTIPMRVLTTSPYNLVFNQLVIVRVTAINNYGPSISSVLNTYGARIRSVPIKMPSISVVSFSDTSVELAWPNLTGE